MYIHVHVQMYREILSMDTIVVLWFSKVYKYCTLSVNGTMDSQGKADLNYDATKPPQAK